MRSFLSCLLGTWSNKFQAQSHPHLFRQVFLRWEKEGDYLISTHWNRKDPDSPYLSTQKKLVVLSDDRVLLEHHGGGSTNWIRNSDCDMLLVYNGTSWWGEFTCNFNTGTQVYAEMYLFGDKLFTIDKATQDDKIVWGGDERYKFIRV